MAERRLQGAAASPGMVLGRFRRLSSDPVADSYEYTAEDLRRAIHRAREELSALAAGLPRAEAEILEAQIAFLGDDELARPAHAAIAAGADAATAWRTALDAEIDGFRTSDDAYFRARASDFEDLRDRVLAALRGEAAAGVVVPAGTIVVAEDLGPSAFLAGQWAEGSALALAGGSPNSHVAMLARGRGIAMVVGLGAGILTAEGEGLVDGLAGEVCIDPGPERHEAARSWLVRQELQRTESEVHAAAVAVTRDGTRISVEFTLAGSEEVATLDATHSDGVGLVRTELFLGDLDRLKDEELQYDAYRRILGWAEGRPVTFRTIDAGGDKPVPGYTAEGELNPFLGMRGIRLSLAHPEIFRVQLRALCRAAVHGEVRVMLPMVSQPAEVAVARRMLQEEADGLARDGIARAVPKLGIMVEVPAVALAPERFDADFYSIGSNDLVQYVLAADRSNVACAELARIDDPSVVHLLRRVADHGRATGKPVSLCGDVGSDPAWTALLLAAGLRSLSIQPRMAGRIKAAIAQVDLGEGHD